MQVRLPFVPLGPAFHQLGGLTSSQPKALLRQTLQDPSRSDSISTFCLTDHDHQFLNVFRGRFPRVTPSGEGLDIFSVKRLNGTQNIQLCLRQLATAKRYPFSSQKLLGQLLKLLPI